MAAAADAMAEMDGVVSEQESIVSEMEAMMGDPDPASRDFTLLVRRGHVGACHHWPA